ncbi:SDR family oxidoreductase [Aureimonas jatrophae]|jgi:3-oxoacyl-[acyl-carrier protein] reductase|uniref:3-oxoacyl-[acyl-carrier protein] reductase n=1 Tax=Aureimonas jatrophae TaxID=1166073 RepID=A0A1H0K1E3_9HYPH|nr:SDR family oxidoreductase [Aureimonas jatrophae]MBB3950895.1 3-oxoacyl-[acyl-carrier protein] reductase [Aureimonas jatrophae]SDO49593.1 3-oxoacyl-[acyl-carrier protein] reductase [Aureimonas jatrophae]
MDLQLAGRRAVVLASSKGLGLAIARQLAAEGAHPLLVGRDENRLRHEAERITAHGAGHASFVVADLGQPGAVDTIAEAAERLGPVDLLVNNSGGPPPGTTSQMTAELLQRQADTMVFPLIALTNRFLPAMRERDFGRILTIASSGVQQPIPNLALSNTLRAALQGWSKTLAAEVAGDGITVNMLLPGRIATDRLEELDQAAAKRTGKAVEEVRESARAGIPAGRYGTPEEFAAVATFLLSGPAAYVTGTTVRCDGGLVRGI